MKSARIILTILMCYAFNAYAQTDSIGVWVAYQIENGDTLLVSVTPEANVISYSNVNYRNSRKYRRTLKRVRKVYPYAMLACSMYDKYLEKIDDFDSKKEKRKYLRGEEKALKTKFEGKIRDITIKEGIILVKLIDRETEQTSYQVLQELKGNSSAFLWQGIARIFDSSLKHQYDPNGDDWMIEEIIQRIQKGQILIGDIDLN